MNAATTKNSLPMVLLGVHMALKNDFGCSVVVEGGNTLETMDY